MLCSIEIGEIRNTTIKQSQVHYWVVADTLEEAMAKAKKQSKDDFPYEEAARWIVLDAEIKDPQNPLT